MKGYLVILGCLFAAYAAPLFANEVPLILEETIQLPVATGYWDVAPTWGRNYYWVEHVSVSPDSSRMVWGDLDSGLFDSMELSGSPLNSPILYLDNDGLPVVIQTTRTYVDGGPGFPPTSYTIARGNETRLSTASIPIQEWSHRSNFSMFFSGEYVSYITTGALVLNSVRLITPPPDTGGNWEGMMSRTINTTWSSGQSSGQTTLCRGNILDRNLDSSVFKVPYSQMLRFVSSEWADHSYLATFGYETRVPQGVSYSGMRLFEIDSSGNYIELTQVENIDPIAMTSVPPNWLPLVVYKINEEIVGWLYNSGESWRIDNTHGSILPAYVLNGENTEQFLLLETSNRQFDIVIAETGQTWGQTSALDSGYAEMKIVGRYHNEKRRLVVRYGLELRIYRFGEPIYTDADDARPELPQELTLSAYPNPFNPTTMIAFDLPKAACASLIVYDLTGRQVQTLFDEQMSAGHHEIGFDGASLPSGIYFARLVANNVSDIHKLILIK